MKTSCYNLLQLYDKECTVVSELKDILHISKKRQGQSESGDRKIALQSKATK